MNNLYIFVTTDRPDQYLNSVVHCIERGTNRIVLLQVEDSKTEQVQLNLLRTNVYNLLQNLSKGFYKYYTGLRKETIVPLDTEYSPDELSKLKAKYIFCLTDNIKWEVERIQYLELRQYISSISRKNKNAIIDVTSVSKVYIGDIFACSLLENISKLCTFELLIKPDFDKPWNTLIHELEEGKQYKYTNLVETPIFKESTKAILIRTTPLLVSVSGTVLFVALALATTFIFGSSGAFAQAMSTVGTALGIISFFLIYFPVRGK
ncbi:hypothetical protein SD81_003835 [Tolypothrix campylonemoides VB511288]|nr:hypothetical protein SD81_003835 [Tolypothrix campylonemoides VB511288]